MTKHSQTGGVSRRRVLKGVAVGAVGLAMPAVWRRAHGAQRLVVSDPGGTFEQAFGEAFYKPFAKETGVEVVYTARQNNPASLIKAAVETKTYPWDVTTVTRGIYELTRKQDLLEELDLSGPDTAEIPGDLKTSHWIGVDVTAFIVAYRTDAKYGQNGPKTFADIWDINKFPGRRAMRKVGRDAIEVALRADGVPGGPEIYKVLSTEAGWDRAFKALDRIKPHVGVWWGNAAQSTQILKTGEADICPTWNGRAQAALDAGAPVKLDWGDGFSLVEGWVIPKGNPNAELGRKFIKFCSNAKRQAEYTKLFAYGPTNPNAYKYMEDRIARLLPTHPDNVKKIAQMDEVFWGDNHEKAEKRLAQWLLT